MPPTEDVPTFGTLVRRSTEASARWLLAVAASLAPKRYWPGWEAQLPIDKAGMASAVVTIALGFFVGFQGFLSFAEGANRRIAEAVYETDRDGIRERDIMIFGTTTLIAFVLFTPTGWLALYFALTGTARAAGVVADSPFGDPALSFTDWAARDLWQRVRSRRARHEREEAEGPELPDRAVAPESLRMSGCDVVIVASRRKRGWDPGAFVVDGPRTYRLGTPVDRHYPVGLRALYPLTRVDSVEALRRWVAYELPPLSSTEALFAPLPSTRVDRRTG